MPLTRKEREEMSDLIGQVHTWPDSALTKDMRKDFFVPNQKLDTVSA